MLILCHVPPVLWIKICTFQKGVCSFLGFFVDLLPTFKYIFHVKKSTLILNFKPDYDPHGSHWFGSLDPGKDPQYPIEIKSWIRLQIRTETNADPQR
jgi:hypothetical protein